MRAYTTFVPAQHEQIIDFFHAQNYAVIEDALSADEIRFLNGFVDDSQRQTPAEWGIGQAAVHSHGQILVNHPELDHYARHPHTLPLVKAILGPELRFSQIDFRDVPVGIGEKASLHFHRDRGFVPEQYWEEKRSECVYVCAIYYLSDVGDGDTCFCVVPNSYAYDTLEDAKNEMGTAYREIPIRGKAGTLVLYNIAIYHTRQLGANDAGRRTMHHYFSREGNPSLTNWALIPQRLAEHADAETKAYYSHWTEKMQDYVKAGFSEAFYQEHCGGKKSG
jgi:ectoine hydroxylase-related dioxygenase (phytanoyl-CoA dioxygenase family)